MCKSVEVYFDIQVSNAHSCNKIAHITQNMCRVHMCTLYVYGKSLGLHMHRCGLTSCWGGAGWLGAGGLCGITPTNHLKMHTGEKSDRCKQYDYASSQAYHLGKQTR